MKDNVRIASRSREVYSDLDSQTGSEDSRLLGRRVVFFRFPGVPAAQVRTRQVLLCDFIRALQCVQSAS